jgi:hypothetical protein
VYHLQRLSLRLETLTLLKTQPNLLDGDSPAGWSRGFIAGKPVAIIGVAAYWWLERFGFYKIFLARELVVTTPYFRALRN